jgi:phosphatidylinositol alpha-mannosyltransferase
VLSGAALFLDKGYELAIEAMRLVGATHGAEYVVSGAGDDAARIAALAERATIPIRFTGQLSEEDWFAALNAADIVLHPTSGEIFPNIVAEAMLLGRPLVAVDSGATPELVGAGGQAGVLVRDGDARAMAGALRSLLDDAARRQALGSRARARIVGEFPIERMERGYVRLLEQLAGVSQSLPASPSARQPV